MDALHKLHHRLLNIDSFPRIKKSFHLQASQLLLAMYTVAHKHFVFIFYLPLLSRTVSKDREALHAGRTYFAFDLNRML